MINTLNSGNEIYFNFTYYALKLLGKNLYTNPWVAISELVANGLDAGAPQIYVTIDLMNKKNSTIEIFDCGSGMSYEDLSDKYALIGRNKREDLNDEEKVKMLGRKGIGKLAALYLSPIYYLTTKTKEENSCWVVNSTKFKDDDIPKLERIYNYKEFLSGNMWEKFTTGTMIQLKNVNLENIGEEKINSLKAILSDFYLLNKINSEIYISVLNKKNRIPNYEKIEKTIFFNTMYAIFDNTNQNYYKRLQKEIYLSKKNDLPVELDYPRPTQVLKTEDYPTEGILDMVDLNGNECKVKYELKGWIGIQGSLDDSIQRRNNPEYKKILYRGNTLRLYVRNKLAVDNLMNYIKSSQAFANYIEGEISFDILDDDKFEDISTSNREGYPITDVRIQKLLQIIKKITTSLFAQRTKVGKEINDQLKDYNKLKEKEAEEKVQKEAKQKEEAEEKMRQAECAANQAQEEAEKTKAQNRVIFNTINESQKSFVSKLHLIKTNTLAIKGAISEISHKIDYKLYREIPSIAISADRILSAIKYSASAQFNLEDEFIYEDLIEYIQQYTENVLAIQYPNITFNYNMNVKFLKRFQPQNISLILDNIVSNASKANSTQLDISVIENKTFILFIFKDNGKGLDTNINLESLFDFGWSNTFGTGIGLYNVREVIKELGGSVSLERNVPKGVKIIVRIYK